MFVYFFLKILHCWWSSWEGWECLLIWNFIPRLVKIVVWTCKPLIWLVRGTSTFLIRKKRLETVALNSPSNFAIPLPVISLLFYELRFRFNSKIIYKGSNVIKNIKCPIVFQLQGKLFGQELWVSDNQI